MKLGAAYNFFDGEEILPYSLESIRKSVDYIVLIYQKTSNFNNTIPKKALDKVKELKKQGLIDKLSMFRPDLKEPPHLNESRKRNTGLHECKEAGCTHYLGMDADELYKKEQLEYAKKIMKEGFDGSFCVFVNYFKKPIYQEIDNRPIYRSKAKGEPKTTVPCIFKLYENSKHIHYAYGKKLDILVDPTRMVVPLKQIRIFNEEEVTMHHMSWVRNSIESKLLNNTCRENLEFRRKAAKTIAMYPSWEPGNTDMPFSPKKIKEVENIFDIKLEET